MKNLDSVKKEKNNNKFKYIVCFLVFFVLGALIGIFATKQILGNSGESETDEEVVLKDSVEDITEDENYTELITNLHSYLAKNVIFYTSKGVDMKELANDTKLKLVYNYIITNQLATTETLNQWWAGSTTCENNFLVDTTKDTNGVVVNGNVCTVSKITTTLMTDTYKKLFGDTGLQTNVGFNPSNTKSCVLVGVEYICGNVADTSGVTGTLEPKFEVVKVTKDNDTIVIYEKGYLLDTRSNFVNLNDGYENHYLHASDSSEYYYELRSADNLTFAHTYKMDSNNNYYLEGTKVNKE